jgi:cytochrome b subunit of formate dehydrogenase
VKLGNSVWESLLASDPEVESRDTTQARPVSLPRRRYGWCLPFLLLGFAGLFLQGADAQAARFKEAAANSNAGCLECHKDNTLTTDRGGRKVSLFTDASILAKSTHSSLNCVDCHEGFNADNIPHKNPITPVNCASCHGDMGAKHLFHPRLAATPTPAGRDTSCTACHGTHNVMPAKSADFPFARARQAETCGRCHQAAREQFLASAHGRNYATTPEAPDCLTCHRESIVHPGAKQTRVELKLAQAALCESCHVGKPEVAGKSALGKRFVSSFDQSVHGAALKAGNAQAPTCIDCHGSHEMNQAMVSSSLVNKLHVSETCGKCHRAIATEYDSSVHAAALRKGDLDAPTCTDCHGEHKILAHTNPNSPVYNRNVAQQVCATCHASLRLTQKYGLAANSFKTFTDSYHGLALRGGALEVVNCASCHSSHAIKSPLDPASTVYKGNLVATCGRCHPGANNRFTIGKVHVSPDEARGGSRILYWIANIYLILIGVIVGGMAMHNLADFVKKIRRRLAIQKGLIEEEPIAHRLYLRMTVNERYQHVVLVVTFVLLVVTGFMLRYPEAWWVVGLRNLSARAFEIRSLIHRIAGVVMGLAGVWHLAYLAFTPRGRRLFLDLLPTKRDLTDPFGLLKYNFGLAPEKPKFGRFCYIEKAEYWAMVWGTIVMGVTGVILWFENTSMGFLTKLGFDIARTIHFYEAVLATFAIIVWHFYFVIFNPDIYPMNFAWLTGRMSEKEMLEEHPLELEDLKQLEHGGASPHSKPDDPSKSF